jgi:protoporphyrinogen/coproporphyrinogen III oxidase
VSKIVIIGAGMTGLACGYALAKNKAARHEIVVLEGQDRVGGNIRTIQRDGFLMDAGPDAWLASKPEASALAREANVGEMIGTRPEFRRVYIAYRGRLHAMPEGVVLGVPTRIMPMVMTRLFSLRGKARMALEPFVPRGDDPDESVAAFLERRLGREMVDRLAGPLLGGIFAGDVHRISVRAAFPQFVEQEQKYGSLVLAMRAGRRKQTNAGGSAFVSLREGMSAFPEALARTLDVRLSRHARAIQKKDRGFDILLDGGETLACDVVVVAVSPAIAATLVEGLDDVASETLDSIRSGSSAAVFLGYRREDVAHPLDATGFVVARTSETDLAAATFVTSKWEGRSPEGHVLFRAFLGGIGRERVLERDDDALVALARKNLSALLGRLGEPVLTHVYRHKNASPQPEIGHIARMKRLEDRLSRLPGLFILGNGYSGNGIPDCIKQSQAVAQMITELPTSGETLPAHGSPPPIRG